ncbi:MAG: M48 family metallopeptidase [Proteobacteria bacterium]|nr:M48 family metallopeptidase [Pseudomonadota bacterium]
MPADAVTWIFCAALLASLLVKYWLMNRQARHVHAHRSAVPAPFDGVIGLTAHQRAADYTLAKLRLGLLAEAMATAVLLGWTLLGGLDALNSWLREAVVPRWGAMAYQLALLGAFSAISALLDAPLSLWRTFVLEQRFGFNRMTWALYLKDTLMGTLVTLAVATPLVAALLWLMQASGGWWWLYAWVLLVAFMLLMQVVVPTWIAPLFNRFTPLADTALVERVAALMQRCGFRSGGLFVMDGSRRSAHGNAYFTGLGRVKRVVFFDTLLAKLAPAEVEAVLAHELGHFHHRHVRRRLVVMVVVLLAGLALLGWLAQQPGFYLGLGVKPNLMVPNDALALLLFMLATPPLLFFVAPLLAFDSRRAEFEADAYASAHADGRALRSALLKLYEDNAATLTPDPQYVRWHYSHPPAAQRLAALPA